MSDNPYAAPQTDVSYNPDAQTLELASFLRRAGATIIDSILIIMLTLPILSAVYGMDYWLGEQIVNGWVDFLVSYVMPFVIVVAFWMRYQATPGKMILDVKIVDIDGEPLSLGQSVGRYIGYFLSAIPLGLGYFWMLFDDQNQTWHDKLARTLVVRRR